MKSDYSAVIKELEQLANDPEYFPDTRNYGICRLLEALGYSELITVLKHACHSWEYYSRDTLFPVPSPSNELTPQIAFQTHNLWEGPYGDLRRDLCGHFAKFLKRNAEGVNFEALILYLRALATDPDMRPVCKSACIDYFLPNFGGRELFRLYEESKESWPHYSGSRQHPIPDPDGHRSASKKFYKTTFLWDYDAYGNLRRDLCRHFADYLESRMITKERYLEVISELVRELRALYNDFNTFPRLPLLGICEILGKASRSDYSHRYYLKRDFRESLSSWSHFSGEYMYPIPDPDRKMSGQGIFHSAVSLWKGPYGDLRRDLCRHLADYLENKYRGINNGTDSIPAATSQGSERNT